MRRQEFVYTSFMEDENKRTCAFYLLGRVAPEVIVERISAGKPLAEVIVERPLHRVFFDTSDNLLQRASLAFVYEDSDATKISLTLEWIRPPESPVEPLAPLSQPGERPGKEVLGQGPLADWLQPLLAGRKLERRFSETGQEKILWVGLEEGRLQVTVRQLVLQASGRRRNLFELEIEAEPEKTLPEELLLGLQSIPGLTPDERSAPARRIELLNLEEATPPKHAVGPRMLDLALSVLRTQWRHLKKNEAGTLLGLDREALHHMRVATRRLRVAMRLFRDVLPARRTQRLRLELGWLGNVLGSIRDLDVQLEGLRYEAEDLSEGERAVIAIFRLMLQNRRAVLRRRLLRLLHSRRYERLVRRMECWLSQDAPRFPRASLGRRPSVAVAPIILRRRLARLLDSGGSLSPSSPDASYHRERILCKRLRYACEFFELLYGDGLAELVTELIQLQDTLGAHQDAVVAAGLLQQVASHIKGPREKTVPLFLGLGQRIYAKQVEAKELRASFLRAFKSFCTKKHLRAAKQAFKELKLA
jgi:CHAD domain-containing protein